MILKIKNMVCDRCISAVKDVLDNKSIAYKSISLGDVELEGELNDEELIALSKDLDAIGFELLQDKTKALLNDIKTQIIKFVHYSESGDKKNISDFLQYALNHDYQYMSRLFASEIGLTIEKYAILQKVERVKELLEYKELSLKEIAFKLNYSSTAHLSRQFKKETGMSASEYRKIKSPNRKPLDKI